MWLKTGPGEDEEVDRGGEGPREEEEGWSLRGWRTVLPPVGGSAPPCANSPLSPLSEAAAQYNPEPPVSRPRDPSSSGLSPASSSPTPSSPIPPLPSLGSPPAIKNVLMRAPRLSPGSQPPRYLPPSLLALELPSPP